MSSESLTIAKELAQAARARYEEEMQNLLFHGLVLGEKGAGKTSLIETLPAPVYVFSFDPGGTQVLRDAIAAGRVIADTRFEEDGLRAPKAYLKFEQEFNRMGTSGAFEHFASVAIDSLSTMANSIIWQIMAKENRLPAGMNASTNEKQHGMRIQDWGTVLNVFIMLARSLGTLPCHTMLIGHVGKEKDEVMGGFVNTVALPGQSSLQVPINLSEVYILQTKATPRGTERFLLTQNDGLYKATTRLGAKGLFAKEEVPNIKELLKKAGLPYEDKELLV